MEFKEPIAMHIRLSFITGSAGSFLIASLAALLLPKNAQAAEALAPLASGLKMFWALLLVLGLMLILSFFAKRYIALFAKKSTASIQIIGVQSLLPKRSLMIVRVKEQDYLVGTSNEGVTSIIPLQPSVPFSTILQSSQEEQGS